MENDKDRFKPIAEDRLQLLNSILDGRQDYNATIHLTEREEKYLDNNHYCGFCRSKCKGNHYVSPATKGY